MDRLKILLKSLFLQTLMSFEYMQKYGYKLLTNNKWNNYINSHPFFAPLITLFINKNKSKDSIDIICSISAMIGDQLFWNILKPIIIIIALFLLIFKQYTMLIIVFLIYNISILLFKIFIYNYAKKVNYEIERLYSEYYFTKLPKYMQTFKIVLLGILGAYIVLFILSYLKIAFLYVIITFLISILLFFINIDFSLIILILIVLYFVL